MNWQYNENSSDPSGLEKSSQLIARLIDILEYVGTPRDAFSSLTKTLQTVYNIRKGFLALREGDQLRFLAVATFSNGKIRKNLSLRLPTASSLFEKVAETGHIYADNFAELYDGNMIEKQLLLDDYTQSFMLRPLKFEGEVVALLGYSADTENAFVTFEEGLLDPVLDLFAQRIAQLQPVLK